MRKWKAGIWGTHLNARAFGPPSDEIPAPRRPSCASNATSAFDRDWPICVVLERRALPRALLIVSQESERGELLPVPWTPR